MPSYLLKVTKLLVRISQFEFLVMKNIFVYKLFLSLDISSFSLFLYKNCNLPLKKVTPLFPSNPTVKIEVLSSPPLLKIGWKVQPPSRKGGGGCTLWDWLVIFRKRHEKNFPEFLSHNWRNSGSKCPTWLEMVQANIQILPVGRYWSNKQVEFCIQICKGEEVKISLCYLKKDSCVS